MSKPAKQSTSDLAARRERAAEEGRKALAEYEAHDVAVRKNMAKLKALRLAKEAEVAETDPQPSAKGKKTISAKGTAKSNKTKA